MAVQIAVPFAPEAREGLGGFFVKARIANVREMGDGDWRVGVEFLR